MSSLEELWDTLRPTGLECLAPCLVQRHPQCQPDGAALPDCGIKSWQIGSLFPAGGSYRPSGPGGRADLPVAAPSRRASFAVALQAADPNNRQQALQNLKNDMMSRSTNPASDARVRTYMSLCRAWDVTSFPLDTTNVIPVQKFGYVLLRLVWASTTSS